MTRLSGGPALELDLRSAIPPYEQLRGQLARLVAVGELPVGTPLPSVRALAADLGIAPNTVVRAYRELEGAGIVRTARGKGTVVADAPPPPDAAEVHDAVARAVALARTAGWARERVDRALDEAWGAAAPER